MKINELNADHLDEIIRKLDSGEYRLYSKRGKNLGTYDTRAGAEKRERQVQYFKHANEAQDYCNCGCDCNNAICETCNKPKQTNEVYDPEYGHNTDDHVVKHVDDNDQDFWAVYNGDGDIVKVFYTKSKAIDYAEKNHDALMKNEIVAEKWSEKYKRSINCNNPKGFSQKAHCQGRKKSNESIDQFDPEEPMASTVAVSGYGTMNLATLMRNVASTIKQLSELRNDPAGFRRLNYELYDSGVLQAKLEALIVALDQLQEIKRKGGKRSVNIQREAAKQELPVDLEKIFKAIQQLESRNYFTPEEADDMRRAVRAVATGRSTIFPQRLLQLLTTVA